MAQVPKCDFILTSLCFFHFYRKKGLNLIVLKLNFSNIKLFNLPSQNLAVTVMGRTSSCFSHIIRKLLNQFFLLISCEGFISSENKIKKLYGELPIG